MRSDSFKKIALRVAICDSDSLNLCNLNTKDIPLNCSPDAAVAVLVVHVEDALLQPLQVPPRVARPHQAPEVLPVDVAVGALLAEVGELRREPIKFETLMNLFVLV